MQFPPLTFPMKYSRVPVLLDTPGTWSLDPAINMALAGGPGTYRTPDGWGIRIHRRPGVMPYIFPVRTLEEEDAENEDWDEEDE